MFALIHFFKSNEPPNGIICIHHQCQHQTKCQLRRIHWYQKLSATVPIVINTKITQKRCNNAFISRLLQLVIPLLVSKDGVISKFAPNADGIIKSNKPMVTVGKLVLVTHLTAPASFACFIRVYLRNIIIIALCFVIFG